MLKGRVSVIECVILINGPFQTFHREKSARWGPLPLCPHSSCAPTPRPPAIPTFGLPRPALIKCREEESRAKETERQENEHKEEKESRGKTLLSYITYHLPPSAHCHPSYQPPPLCLNPRRGKDESDAPAFSFFEWWWIAAAVLDRSRGRMRRMPGERLSMLACV